MDKYFQIFLKKSGATSVTLEVFMDEQIRNRDIFQSLSQQHFGSLGQRLKIGQHVLFMCLWRQGDHDLHVIFLYLGGVRCHYFYLRIAENFCA